ncbi:Pyridoxamine 5'-phosphate oxidase [Nocardioides dokdonensis FR1436]|uniref:Pyridoxamine 5'-phosphate oxidase n=1 Tax=Nocardioides dokdonensis FR1436 TaxID=1300347 RepID=A0A1A9GJ30_9ACTN|nr:MSMEG_1061 family FMN-dependent PPOX-type flavoprotein [Nocardioides dokdonensis]ANH38327.1 Pyridoxamine 5'-phosphate oxidase [Nocardioides dokdonensis FR1436]
MSSPTPRPDPAWHEVADVDELVALLGEPLPVVRAKVHHALLSVDRDWLGASPFCVVGTADADGRCDVSPKGDPAGSLVHVIDDVTIAIAERPGNRLADGYRNILTNPHVGLDFVIPGRGDTLRINGRARLVRDAPFFDALVVRGRRPLLAMVVDVEEVFFHCAKAYLRSRMWEPETWAPEAVVPRRALLAAAAEPAVEDGGRSPAELEEYYGPSYAQRLY